MRTGGHIDGSRDDRDRVTLFVRSNFCPVYGRKINVFGMGVLLQLLRASYAVLRRCIRGCSAWREKFSVRPSLAHPDGCAAHLFSWNLDNALAWAAGPYPRDRRTYDLMSCDGGAGM
jgi:hypothetical protein